MKTSEIANKSLALYSFIVFLVAAPLSIYFLHVFYTIDTFIPDYISGSYNYLEAVAILSFLFAIYWILPSKDVILKRTLRVISLIFHVFFILLIFFGCNSICPSNGFYTSNANSFLLILTIVLLLVRLWYFRHIEKLYHQKKHKSSKRK